MSQTKSGMKVNKSTEATVQEHHSRGKRVNGKDVYDWALYELSSARRVEASTGIDTSDLREQIVVALQQDLYDWIGEDLTI